MKVTVSDACIACGICVDACPEVFGLGDDGLAHPLAPEVDPDLEVAVREACEACPVDAIEIED